MVVFMKQRKTRQVSSMNHSARPTVSPVVNIVFAWNLFCFEKWGRTDNMCKNNDHYRAAVTVGWPRGSTTSSSKITFGKLYLMAKIHAIKCIYIYCNKCVWKLSKNPVLKNSNFEIVVSCWPVCIRVEMCKVLPKISLATSFRKWFVPIYLANFW